MSMTSSRLSVLATMAALHSNVPLWAIELKHNMHHTGHTKQPNEAVQTAAELKRARKAAKRAKDAGHVR